MTTNGLVRRRDLLAAGYTDDEVRARLRAEELLSLRRGCYLRPGRRPPTAEEWHAARTRATLPDLAAGSVASHASAAVVHGLPVWGLRLDRVRVTRDRRSGARRTRQVDLRSAPLAPDEITEIDGIPVTTVARLAVDIGRSAPFEKAVCVVDAALHQELTTVAELDDALARAKGWPGCPAARRAVRFADGRSESVGESRSRVAMYRAGLPAPVLQQPFVTADGVDLGRVDFWWEREPLAGEFDGLIKYGRLLKPGQQPGDAVVAEKCREDLIRAEDTRFARWIWKEISPFDDTARRIARALAQRR